MMGSSSRSIRCMRRSSNRSRYILRRRRRSRSTIPGDGGRSMSRGWRSRSILKISGSGSSVYSDADDL